jgi:hypothetical protein
MKQLKKDPVHRKIMHTKDTLVDDFDPEEALEAAVDTRKFLIKRLLKGHKFYEENDDIKMAKTCEYENVYICVHKLCSGFHEKCTTSLREIAPKRALYI